MRWRWLLLAAVLLVGGCDTADEFQAFDEGSVCTAPRAQATLTAEERAAVDRAWIQMDTVEEYIGYGLQPDRAPKPKKWFNDIEAASRNGKCQHIPYSVDPYEGIGKTDGPECPVSLEMKLDRFKVGENGVDGTKELTTFEAKDSAYRVMGVIKFESKSTFLYSDKRGAFRAARQGTMVTDNGTVNVWACYEGTFTPGDADRVRKTYEVRHTVQLSSGAIAEITFNHADPTRRINGGIPYEWPKAPDIFAE